MRLKRVKNAAIRLLVVTLISLARRLPRRLALACGPGLGLLSWLFAGRERRRALENLARARVGRSRRERGRLVRRMFGHLGQSAMECVAMDAVRGVLGTDQSPVCFEEGAKDALLAAAGQGRGVLFVTAHLGNWELMAAEVARWAPVSVLSKPSYDPSFTRLIEEFRHRNGVRCIAVTEAGHVRKVVGALRKREVVGVLLDQPVPTGCQVTFFGQPVWTSELVARLHQRTGAPVVVGTIHRSLKRPGRHIVFISEVVIDKTWSAQRATQEVTSQLEAAVRRSPEQWAWSLDRWRSAEKRVLSSPA